MAKNQMSAAQFREQFSKGPAKAREEVKEITLKKKAAHKSQTLSTEQALNLMGTFFELPVDKVKYFITQLQITNKIN